MSRFKDVYLDSHVPGYPCISSPRWSTEIVEVDSGAEQVTQRWATPLHKFTLPEAVRDMSVFNAVRDHWLVMRGPAYTWPWRDPLDFASATLVEPNVPPTLTALDQPLGIGDGVTTQFQIIKRYTRGSQTFDRPIVLPILSSILIASNGVPVTSGFSVSRPGGIVTFDTPPINDRVLTCGFFFDVEVRFEDDKTFDGIVQSFGLGGFADINLSEVRPC
jgi:uncharacterized protein (TIGR02217 family)